MNSISRSKISLKPLSSFRGPFLRNHLMMYVIHWTSRQSGNGNVPSALMSHIQHTPKRLIICYNTFPYSINFLDFLQMRLLHISMCGAV